MLCPSEKSCRAFCGFSCFAWARMYSCDARFGANPQLFFYPPPAFPLFSDLFHPNSIPLAHLRDNPFAMAISLFASVNRLSLSSNNSSAFIAPIRIGHCRCILNITTVYEPGLIRRIRRFSSILDHIAEFINSLPNPIQLINLSIIPSSLHRLQHPNRRSCASESSNIASTSAKTAIKDTILTDQASWDVWYQNVRSAVQNFLWEYFNPDETAIYERSIAPIEPYFEPRHVPLSNPSLGHATRSVSR